MVAQSGQRSGDGRSASCSSVSAADDVAQAAVVVGPLAVGRSDRLVAHAPHHNRDAGRNLSWIGAWPSQAPVGWGRAMVGGTGFEPVTFSV